MSPFHLNKESVLGQDDIDSLVSGVSNQGASPAAQANAAPPLVEAVQPAPPVRVMNAEERPAAGTDLAQRIEKLEEAVSKLAQSVGGAKSQTQLATLTKQVETLAAQVRDLRQHAAHTVGYRLQETFECASCGQKGLVAGKVKCTACGEEVWTGWWQKA